MVSELQTTPDVGDAGITPAASCALLADFIDVLLPGDEFGPRREPSGCRPLLPSGF